MWNLLLLVKLDYNEMLPKTAYRTKHRKETLKYRTKDLSTMIPNIALKALMVKFRLITI